MVATHKWKLNSRGPHIANVIPTTGRAMRNLMLIVLGDDRGKHRWGLSGPGVMAADVEAARRAGLN